MELRWATGRAACLEEDNVAREDQQQDEGRQVDERERLLRQTAQPFQTESTR